MLERALFSAVLIAPLAACSGGGGGGSSLPATVPQSANEATTAIYVRVHMNNVPVHAGDQLLGGASIDGNSAFQVLGAPPSTGVGTYYIGGVSAVGQMIQTLAVEDLAPAGTQIASATATDVVVPATSPNGTFYIDVQLQAGQTSFAATRAGAPIP